MNHLPGDVPILGRNSSVAAREIRIIAPNMVGVMFGGLDTGDSVAYLQVVDMANAVVWRVPLNMAQLEALHSQTATLRANLEPTDY